MRIEYSEVYSQIPNEIIGTELGADITNSMRMEATYYAALRGYIVLIGPPNTRAYYAFRDDCSELVWPTSKIYYNYWEVDD